MWQECDVSLWTHVPEVIGHRNIIKTDIMESSIIPPSGDGSIPFSSGEKESNTFMFPSLVEGLLRRHRHVGTASVPRTRLFDNGRILTPAMMEDIQRGYDVRRSVLVNMRKSDELYATVDGPTPNETEAASWRKVHSLQC